jgi:putative flippase GtrA
MAEQRSATGPVALVRRAAADQRLLFLVVGGFNTLLSLAFFIGFQLTFQAIGLGRFDYLVSLVCAQATSTFTSFLTQRYLVFKVRGRFWRDLVRFATVATTAFLGNLALLPFCVEVVGLPPIPAQMVSALVIEVVLTAVFLVVILGATSKVVVDTKAGQNLLYLPLADLMKMSSSGPHELPATKVSSARLARAGTDNGNMVRRQIAYSESPSRRAASDSSSGIVS